MIKKIFRHLALRNKKIFALVRIGDTEGVKQLVDEDPQLLHLELNGESLLHHASKYGYIDICSFLISSGLTTNEQEKIIGATPLIGAVAYGHVACASLLLRNGANVNTQDSNEVSALHYAVSINNSEMVELLLSANPDISPTDKEGRTSLDIARKMKFDKIILLFNKFTSLPKHSLTISK